MNNALIIIEALLVDPETATAVVGGRDVMDRMMRGGWVRPRVKKRKLVRYATEDLRDAVNRMKLEELPE